MDRNERISSEEKLSVGADAALGTDHVNNYNSCSPEYFASSVNKGDMNVKGYSGNQDKKSEGNEKSTEFASMVAAHYNSLEKSDLEKRKVSPIFYLRNFNNWVKGILIRECVSFLPENNNPSLNVLDMCCGKGGDLFKWLHLNTVEHLICSDIAQNSLEECESRYNDLKKKWSVNSHKKGFKCDFIQADCTRVRLKEKYETPSIELNIVSCQFSFHYCFESLPQAECMLRNASECLAEGGVFIGTIPNANEIVKRIRLSKSNCFENKVFKLEMCCEEPYPLFGAKYNFFLEGVVNCPEFLVHFPTFVKLAEKYGLKLLRRETFSDFFNRRKDDRSAANLLRKMKALETYRFEESKCFSKEYAHASIVCHQDNLRQVETLSSPEWEVISLYQTFVFQKVKPIKSASE